MINIYIALEHWDQSEFFMEGGPSADEATDIVGVFDNEAAAKAAIKARAAKLGCDYTRYEVRLMNVQSEFKGEV